MIRHEKRDNLQAFLAARKIVTLVHYPVPIHLQPAYKGRLGDPGSFPVSEQVAREVLSLPLYPELTEAQVDSRPGDCGLLQAGEKEVDLVMFTACYEKLGLMNSMALRKLQFHAMHFYKEHRQ